MRPVARLALYAAVVLAVFAAGFGIAKLAAPSGAAQRTPPSEEATHGHAEPAPQQSAAENEAGHGGGHDEGGHAAVRGVSLSQDGYLLSGLTAPTGVGDEGRLSFTVLDAEGSAVTDYTTSHEKDLHLIVVRSDGTQFRHQHPTIDSEGVWSLPWAWDAPGTYRVFADFVPAAQSGEVTLTGTVQVAGDYQPAVAERTRTTDSVAGYEATLTGDLHAGASSALTIEISKDGQPVTTLQPYLGAFGHLVALREGDLAYLHVHPEGEEPAAGDVSGPTIEFASEAPTPGRYLLYLDFQVDDQVHTVSFVVDATTATGEAGDGHGDHDH